jgi:predicted NBD/HSP70 family sugar kinase
MESNRRVNIAISFGGTKIALAIVGSGENPIICQTDRIEWCDDPMWRPEDPLESLLDLVVNHADKLLQKANIEIENVALVGIAWPGPGHYSEGMLEATFIPGCTTLQPVHQLLLKQFCARFGPSAERLQIISCLDVNARARGETRMPSGAFYAAEGRLKVSGIMLNIATGIAGAIVKEGNVLSTFCTLGETYGQWGRYLFKNKNTGKWVWKPTEDGSIPEYEDENEVRFTDLCGGPALTRRFATLAPSAQQLPPDLASILNTLKPPQRDLKVEKALLKQITQNAYRENGMVRTFVQEVGVDIGSALRCLLNALGEEIIGQKLVLAGGIGEFFGAPPQESDRTDILLAAIQSVLKKTNVSIVRTTVGLDAELVGFAP